MADEVDGQEQPAAFRSDVLALLAGQPGGLALALRSEGFVVDWPPSLPAPPRPSPLVSTMFDLVVDRDHSAIVQAWIEVQHAGWGESRVRLLGQPDRPVRLVFADLRPTDGVLIGIVTPDEMDREVEPLGEILAARPRTFVVRQGPNAEFLEWSATNELFHGWPRDVIMTKIGLDLVHPDDQVTAIDGWMEMLRDGRSRARRWRSLRFDGSYAWIEAILTNRFDDPVDPHALLEVTDVTEEVTAREALEAQELLLNRVAQVVPVGLLQVQPDGRISYTNDRLHEILGTEPAGDIEAQLATVVDADRAALHEALGDVLTGTDREVEVEVRVPAPRRCRFSLRPLLDRVGTVISAIACVSDVTESARRLVQLELELVQRTLHDPLTGLGNRTMLLNRIEDAIADSRGSGDASALLLVDLCEFKVVNDTLGNAAGDDVLRSVSDRLRALARPTDVVARAGGDVFAVLMEQFIDPDHPRRTAEQILAACAQPFEIDGLPCHIDASIGIATTADAPVVHDLLRDADIALHRAKATGRHRFEIFEPEMHTAALSRIELETSLRRAIDRDQLLVVYQPIHDLASGAVTSAEALVRWRHPTHGLVSPADFIPLAEETGLIVPIGRWVLEQACAEALRWAEQCGGDGPRVSVNLSARQLDAPGLVDDVAAVLRHSGLPAGSLVIEITESLVMTSTDAGVDVIERLKALGVALAIDDFGTGYSSLAYLERLPADILKIDKAFVDRITEGGRHRTLINGILGLSRDLGLVAVAEGVETPDQLDTLRALRCPAAQGYLFSRPLEAPAIRSYLERSRAEAVSRLTMPTPTAAATLSTSASGPRARVRS